MYPGSPVGTLTQYWACVKDGRPFCVALSTQKLPQVCACVKYIYRSSPFRRKGYQRFGHVKSTHESIHGQLTYAKPKRKAHMQYEKLSCWPGAGYAILLAFIERTGKTFSCECVWLTCIFIVDMTNASSCCSHPCRRHRLQVLWLLWRKVSRAGCSKLFPWHYPSALDLKDCITDLFFLVLKNFAMDHLPLDLQFVGSFRLAQVQLSNKKLQHHSSIGSHQTPQDISHKASDFQLHRLHRSKSHEPLSSSPSEETKCCNRQMGEAKPLLFPISKWSRLGLSMPLMMTQSSLGFTIHSSTWSSSLKFFVISAEHQPPSEALRHHWIAWTFS